MIRICNEILKALGGQLCRDIDVYLRKLHRPDRRRRLETGVFHDHLNPHCRAARVYRTTYGVAFGSHVTGRRVAHVGMHEVLADYVRTTRAT